MIFRRKWIKQWEKRVRSNSKVLNERKGKSLGEKS